MAPSVRGINYTGLEPGTTGKHLDTVDSGENGTLTCEFAQMWAFGGDAVPTGPGD